MVTLTGENSFLLGAELAQLAQPFLEEYGAMALERLAGDEVSFERIQEALQSLPFLTAKKMVILRAPSVSKQFTEHVEHLLAEIPETTDVILVEPKLDKRSGYYKLLKQITDFREITELDRARLSQWLVATAKEEGGSLSQTEAMHLIDRVGANQQLLGHELEKLLLYDSNVTRRSIDLLTEPTPQSTIFELLDAAFAGNTKRALALYEEQRALKVEPQQIIAMLAWQLHVLALIKVAGSRTADQIAREAKMSPFVVRKSMGIVSKLSLKNLKRLVAELLAIDSRLKRESIDADEALRNYLMNCS